MSFNKIIILTTVLFAARINAQSFDLEQTAQLIRPRIKLDSKYTFGEQVSGKEGFTCLENSASTTFPIKRQFKTEVNINPKDFKLKGIFKKNVRLKASQLLGTLKVAQRQLSLDLDSTYNKNLYYANAGIIGLHLTKKYRLLFYSGNLNINEEDKTINKLVPRFSGVIGQYHIKGLRKSFYYGLALTYSDGLFVPSPFFGGSQPIGKNFSLNYTLPALINLQYHNNKSYTILGVKTDGFRSGVKLKHDRVNMSYANAAAYLNFRYRFSNTFQAQAECGYNFYQYLSFDAGNRYRTPWPLFSGFYANASLNIYFGKSLLEKIVEQVF